MRRGARGLITLTVGLLLGVVGIPFCSQSFVSVSSALAAGPNGKVCTVPGIFPGTVVIVPCPPETSPLDDGMGGPPAQQDKCAGERALVAMAEGAVTQAEQNVTAAEGGYETAKAAWEQAYAARTQAEAQVPLAEANVAAAKRALAKARADYHAVLVDVGRSFPPNPGDQARIDAAAAVETAAIAAVTAAENALQAARDAVESAKTAEGQAAQRWSDASAALTTARGARSAAYTKLAAAQRALRDCETRPNPNPDSGAA